jgi:hypothetical protein
VGPVVFIFLILVAIMGAMAAFLLMEFFLSKAPKRTLSPYTKTLVWPALMIPLETREKVAIYLYQRKEYDNRPFHFKKALFCRETGRLFPDAVNFWGKATLDWTFLNKRFQGHWVSWGSLSSLQQSTIRRRHGDMSQFQTEFSSPVAHPSGVEMMYARSKPGPLYVDIDSHVLLGWQRVPDTDIEVMIVQKPIRPL